MKESKNGFGNRWIGTMPKIGIRPTIDGRMNGVRESLEDQTMGYGQCNRKIIKRKPALPGWITG